MYFTWPLPAALLRVYVTESTFSVLNVIYEIASLMSSCGEASWTTAFIFYHEINAAEYCPTGFPR